MYETQKELDVLQRLLDDSHRGAGSHLRSVITDDRRLRAGELSERLHGMCLLVLATASADARPVAGPVDGYFLHGEWYCSSARKSVRVRLLATRPAVSAVHLPGEEFAVSVHGVAELFELADPRRGVFRQAMLDHHLPLQGPDFETWLDSVDPVGIRIVASKMFVFSQRS
jgi:hypothetical protein